MQSQVISEMLLDKREEWQNNTISEMQEKLNSHPAGRYLVADYKKSLVVVYGNSQIGKTSLILNMMGIMTKYQKDVYSVLRANQEYGDSSTITAIIYLISPSDSYGMSFSSSRSKEIEFYDDDQMIYNLSKLRDNIENGGEEERILYIFIPRKYFYDEVLENESFSIMDLPGINSRNKLEKEHVDSVVSRYMSMATVKMIVTKGDSIQDLSSIEVPERIDWRAFPNRYFIVVTMAFSQGSVKNYFSVEKNNRKKTFSEYILEAYSEIPEIIQSKEMEWYPIDIGESYSNLLRTYQEDAEEISVTQKYFTEKIRKAIIRRKGNGLHNIIEDLKSYSKDYYRVNLNSLKSGIADRESKLQLKKAQLSKLEMDKEKYEGVIKEFSTEEINKFRSIEKFDLQFFWKKLSGEIESFVQLIAAIYPEKIKDHDLTILDSYIKFVEGTITSCNDLKEYIGEGFFEEMYPEGISLDLWDEMADLITQQKLELTKMFRPSGVSYFFNKVSRTDVVTKLSAFSENWTRIIYRNINSDVAAAVGGVNAEKERYFQVSQLLEYKKNEKEKLILEIKLLESGLEEERTSLSNWEKKEKFDSELLSTYLHVAKREYEKSKTKLKAEMSESSMDERLQYLILLGLMEQDYNAIVEG